MTRRLLPSGSESGDGIARTATSDRSSQSDERNGDVSVHRGIGVRLSVVLITKDQEWNVARLIRSATATTAWLGTEAEIVLVDSASADDTVSIASSFPIVVYPLSSDQRLTAAAGRYVGFLNTSGEYVLFLDGDMEVIAGWIRSALDAMGADRSIAVVAGRRIDLPRDATAEERDAESTRTVDVNFQDVKHGGGAALYRRSALEEVGSFNPFVYSDEEPELCIRIRYRGGYRVVRLDRPIVYHYSDPIDHLSTLMGRASRNLYVGYGQNLRLHLRSGLLVPYARERGYGLLPLAWVILGAGAVAASALTGSIAWFAVWLLVPVLAVALDAVRKRSIRRAFYGLLNRTLMLAGTIRGFAMAPEDAADYPARPAPLP